MKNLLKKKEILVNGKVESSAKRQIDSDKDQILYQGQELVYEEFLYYMFNKPAGVVSATEDNLHQTVVDLLDDRARQKEVFPVGRLDKDTHGLLLLTNNGDLAHKLLSPKKHVNKIYKAHVKGVMTEADQLAFENGIQLSDHLCLPANLEIIDKDEKKQTCTVKITLKEGKFHQVKRMVKACGKEVTDLQRLTMGPLKLDNTLGLGEFRRLTDQEISSLMEN